MVATDINVEFATGSDAIEIAELSRHLIEYNLHWRYRPSLVRELMRNKSKNVVIARKSGSLVGFGVMTYREESANLDLLAVKAKCRRRGVGRKIVLWLEKVALTAGIMNVFVQVRKTNRGAVRFYERLGFHIVAEAAGYYQGREPAVIMCKAIRQMVGSVAQSRGQYS